MAARSNSREKILAAAAEVARDVGPGGLSLDAVAARAGISKGGLLYNFPNKAKLIQSLVESYVTTLEEDLDAGVGAGETLLGAFVRLSAEASQEAEAPASWLFSAMTEDSNFLDPVKEHRRRLLERLRAEAGDVQKMLAVFFAMEGLRSMKLFGMDFLTDEERQMFVEHMKQMAAEATGEEARPA